jgi:hypothetical protein
MVAKRGTKAVKRNKVENLRVKGMTTQQAKGIEGGDFGVENTPTTAVPPSPAQARAIKVGVAHALSSYAGSFSVFRISNLRTSST